MAVWNKLIKREICISNNIFFNEKIFLGEDYNFLCRLSKYLNKIGKLNYYYYVQEDNGSCIVKSKDIDDVIVGYSDLENFYKENKEIQKLILKKKIMLLFCYIMDKAYRKYKEK